MDFFVSDPDTNLGKVLKYQKPNPIGEDMYLTRDGTVTRDEDKIIKAQRIFIHNHYKPGGAGARKVLKRLREADAGRVTLSVPEDGGGLLDSWAGQ